MIVDSQPLYRFLKFYYYGMRQGYINIEDISAIPAVDVSRGKDYVVVWWKDELHIFSIL